MKWINIKDVVPKDHNRILLVYSSGSYHLASFDKYSKGFKLQNGSFLSNDKDNFHWTELTPPA